jgi:hypothetical protein
MDLLDRYLQAVKTFLPRAQQDDILKELSENLRSQIEDKESALGRPVSEDELAVILKQHGDPLFVASRYRQARHLIGPTLFPLYWFVMKIILVFVAFGYAIAALVMLAENDPLIQVIGAAFGFVGAVLPTFGWVTIVFAVLDIGNAKFRLLEKWNKEANDKFDPRKLPSLRPAVDSLYVKPISRSKTLFELFFTVAFVLWWIRVSPIRQLVLFMTLGPAGLAEKIPFQLGPVWKTLFVPVLLLSLAAIAQQIYTLIYPHRLRFYSVMRLITNGCSLILFYFLIRANELLVLNPGTADAAKFSEPLHIVNLTLHYSLILAAAITAFESLQMIRRLIRIRRNLAMSPAL